MTVRQRIAAIAATLALASAAHGQSIDPAYNTSSLFGVTKATGKLVRYDFATSTHSEVGTVHNVADGSTLTGIQAAGYLAGFQQVHALWTDPANNHAKVVHIELESGDARFTGIDLGDGAAKGAVAKKGSETVVNADGTTSTRTAWRVFVVQDNPAPPPTPPAVGGMVNLNPNNSTANEFSMTTPSATITRDTIKDVNIVVDAQGTYYAGSASFIHIKPKGNGNQNSIILNGQKYNLDNSTTYEFTGTFTVRLFNDHVKNAKAMGHWWIGIDGQTATVTENGTEIVTPPPPYTPTSHLVTIHTETGQGTTSVQLSRQYSGLATTDGTYFYTMSGSNLYRINASTKNEVLIGSPGASFSFSDLEFIGSTLYGFNTNNNKLVPLSTTTGAPLGSGSSLGLSDLGTFVTMPTSDVPAKSKLAFD